MKITSSYTIVTCSWDDGQKEDIALSKLLEKYEIRGTFYVTKNYRDNLSEKEIYYLSKKHEIGAHTINHPDLTKLDYNSAYKEVAESKAFLENIIGSPVNMFCYPYGKYNYAVSKIVESAGFFGARTCIPTSISCPNNKFEWGITLHISNGSPINTLKICLCNKLSLHSYTDWATRARKLFDLICAHSGVFHFWGHSPEVINENAIDKFESLLEYISFKNDIYYLSNCETIKYGLKSYE